MNKKRAVREGKGHSGVSINKWKGFNPHMQAHWKAESNNQTDITLGPRDEPIYIYCIIAKDLKYSHFRSISSLWTLYILHSWAACGRTRAITAQSAFARSDHPVFDKQIQYNRQPAWKRKFVKNEMCTGDRFRSQLLNVFHHSFPKPHKEIISQTCSKSF